MNSRTVYSIIGVFGYVGGITSSFAIIFGFFLLPYSEMCFRMDAVSELYLSGDLNNSKHIKFSASDKLVSYFGSFGFFCCCCRKSQMEIAERGSDLMDDELDAIDLVLTVKQLKVYVKKNLLDWKKLDHEITEDEAKRVIKLGELKDDEKVYYRIKNPKGVMMKQIVDEDAKVGDDEGN